MAKNKKKQTQESSQLMEKKMLEVRDFFPCVLPVFVETRHTVPRSLTHI